MKPNSSGRIASLLMLAHARQAGVKIFSTLIAITVFLGILIQIGCAGVTSSPANTQTGTQSGSGAPALSLSTTSVSFGSVTVGSSASQSVTVSNTGTATLTITQATLTGQEFSLAGFTLPVSIAAGQQATATIGFSPTSTGSASGAITVASNASSSPVTISLSGAGVTSAQLLGASTSSISFGNVADGTSLSQNVILTNNGTSSVTISSVTVSGTGFAASGVSNGTVLSSKQTATLAVTFDPTTAGAATGSVVVASNATNSPLSVALSGTGVTTATVALTWTASTSSGVTGYNVYRGTTLGSYSRISSAVPGTAYSDSTVESGQDLTYYYVVTAVNSSGEESADSNSASVKVP